MEPKAIQESDFQNKIDSALESGELEEDDLLKFAIDYTENIIIVFREEKPSEFLLQFDGIPFAPDEDNEPETDPEPARIEGEPWEGYEPPAPEPSRLPASGYSVPPSGPPTRPSGEPEPPEEPEPSGA